PQRVDERLLGGRGLLDGGGGVLALEHDGVDRVDEQVALAGLVEEDRRVRVVERADERAVDRSLARAGSPIRLRRAGSSPVTSSQTRIASSLVTNCRKRAAASSFAGSWAALGVMPFMKNEAKFERTPLSNVGSSATPQSKATFWTSPMAKLPSMIIAMFSSWRKPSR